MDIAAWQSLSRQDPAAAAAEFDRRRQRLPAAQQHAVWSEEIAPVFSSAADNDAPLAGVPFAIKDLFHVAGLPTRAGGILPARPAKRDGALIAALRTAGAVPVGKTHLHEFAYGLTGENPHFGDVVHPQFPDRTAGGSSSGSAAVVAAGVVPFALGTDTGGSLRVPAAFCGLYSWREQPGLPWIHDAFPLAPSFDTAGWLTQSAADIRHINTALRGPFPASESSPRGAWLSAAALGVAAAEDDVARLEAAARQFTDNTLEPESDFAMTWRDCGPAYGVLQSTEAFAIHQETLDRRRADYGDAVWQRIDRGRRWTRTQVDAARVKTMQVRLAFTRFWQKHDFLVMPVAPGPALRHAECDQAHRDALLALTTPVSLAGLPALTVPVSRPDGLSLGLQIIFPAPHCAALDWVLERCASCSRQRPS